MVQRAPFNQSFQLIAHRGLPQYYPENSLIGIEAAINVGAKFIEIDIQLTQDQIPLVFHDEDLERLTAKKGSIVLKRYQQLSRYLIIQKPPSEDLFEKNLKHKIPLLTQVVELLQKHPKVFLFVDIKLQSLKCFGMKVVLEKILPMLKPIVQRFIIISHDSAVLLAFRSQCQDSDSTPNKIGWILENYDEMSKAWVMQHQPEYIICNRNKIPSNKNPLWQGSWQWILYEYALEDLSGWIPPNVDFIETNNIRDVLASVNFK